jgi:hypothetical protein
MLLKATRETSRLLPGNKYLLDILLHGWSAGESIGLVRFPVITVTAY